MLDGREQRAGDQRLHDVVRAALQLPGQLVILGGIGRFQLREQRQREVERGADGAVRAEHARADVHLVKATVDHQLVVEVFDALHLVQVEARLLHAGDGAVRQDAADVRIVDVNLHACVAREVVQKQRQVGVAAQLHEVFRDLLHAKLVVVGHGGDHRVILQCFRGLGVFHRLVGGDGRDGGHQPGLFAAVVVRGGHQAVDAFLVGEQRAFRAAAADEEACRALGNRPVHQRVQRLGAELAVCVKRGDRGDKEAAHVLHLLHAVLSFICGYHMFCRRIRFSVNQTRFNRRQLRSLL